MPVKKEETVHVDDVSLLEPVNDDPVPLIVADAPAEPTEPKQDDEPAEPAERPVNPRELKLKEIAERRKKEREAEAGPEFTGDFSDPSQTVGNIGKPPPEVDLTPEFAKPKAPETGPSSLAAQPPKTIKIKVDHEEFERDIAQVAELADMTIEEVEAQPERAKRYAQRELAAQRRLDRANEILRGVQQRRPNDPAPHQGQDDELTAEPIPGRPTTGVDLKKVVEDLQFGADPEEVANRLNTAITQAARETAASATLEQRVQDDFALTVKAYETIKSANPDLFADPNNEAVMQRMLTDGYREDLRAIGVPEDRIPRDVQQLADWHRLYRVQGQKVRAPEKLLGDVKDKFVAWRGGTSKPNPQPAPRPGAPAVNVDRAARRQALPAQPPRASAPMQVPQAQTPQKTSRADALAKMRRARGQVTA